MLGEPYYRASILAFFYTVINGHNGRGTVMEGPVELNSARHPSAVRADERGLDNVLTVKEVITRDLIVRLEYSSAERGNYGKADVVVLKSDDRPLLLCAMLAVRGRNHSVGVGISRSSLMVTCLCKHWHLFCLGYRIRRYHPLLNCNVHR